MSLIVKAGKAGKRVLKKFLPVCTPGCSVHLWTVPCSP